VKVPRVPIADNTPGGEMPKFRNLWEHIRVDMPKTGRGKAAVLDALALPLLLKSAIDALYGHYAETFELWRDESIAVPPVFIVVCQTTAASKLLLSQRAAGDYGRPHINQ
jgi:type III restriction enzyme